MELDRPASDSDIGVRVEGVVGSDAAAVLDVTSLSGRGRSCRVTVDHPEYVPATDTVSIRQPEQRVTLRIERAADLRGRVVDEEGRPVEDAWLTLWDQGEGALDPPKRQDLPPARSGSDGSFALRSFPGDFWIVGWREDRRAAAARVTAVVGRSVEVPPLVLARGAVIRGRVKGSLAALRGSRMTAWWNGSPWRTRPFEPVGRIRYAGGGGAVFVRRETTIGEDGTYAFLGLEPGAWRIEVEAPVWGSTVHPLAQDQATRVVRAPAEGVDFDVSRSLLRFTVFDDRDPVAGAGVVVEGEIEMRITTRETGRCDVVVPAGSKGWFRMQADGVLPGRRPYTAGQDGFETPIEVRIARAPQDLVAGHAGTSPEVWPRFRTAKIGAYGPDGAQVSARCRVFGPDGGRLEVRFESEELGVRYASAERLPAGGNCTAWFPERAAYSLEFEADGYVTTRIPLLPEAGAATPLRVDVALPAR